MTIRKVNEKMIDPSLLQKVNDHTTQLAEKVSKINLVISAKDYGAKGDGVTDDRAKLQSAIDYLFNAGGGVIILPPGKYKITSPGLIWKSKVSLIGYGKGNSILYPVGQRFPAIGQDHAIANEANPKMNCIFEKFEIDGTGFTDTVSYTATKGMFMTYLKDCIFRDLYIHDTVGTGLGVDFLDNCVIDNVVTENCGRLWNNDEVGCAGIGIGTGMMPNENLVISNCRSVGDGNFGIFIEKQGVAVYQPKGITIHNCVVRDSKNIGIGLKSAENTVVSSCVSYGHASYGISASQDLNNVLINNCIVSDNGGDGIYVSQGDVKYNVAIKHNKSFKNTKSGITVNVALPEITFENIEIVGNEIYENHNAGIKVQGAGYSVKGLKITGNRIFLNDHNGIMIESDADHVEINDNTVFNNVVNPTTSSLTKQGIRLNGSVYNYLHLINNWVYDSRTTKTQLVGIVQSGTSVINYGRIEMNDTRTNATSGMTVGGAGNTNTIVANNI